MKYIVLVCADCNDADYAYRAEVVSEEGLSEVKEMLKSIKKLREVYKETHERVDLSHSDNLPYFLDVYESLCNYEDEQGEYEDEWIEKISREDIDKFFAFCCHFLPHGISDLDSMPHTIEAVTAYSLESDSPIALL